MCKCIHKVSDELAKFNTTLRTTIALKKGGVARVFVSTEEIEHRRGKRPVTLVASFCPFCGKEYEKPASPKTKPPKTLPAASRKINPYQRT